MKKWRCTVCGYVFDPEKGDPEHGIPAGTSFEQLPANWVCPLCGVGTEMFEPVEEAPKGIDTESPVASGKAGLSETLIGMNDPQKMQSALFKISYGLFVVSSIKGDKLNGQCSNTVFQITSEPMRIAIGINKNNLTHEFITDSAVVGITVLGEDGHDLVRRFGYSSGRDKAKFEDIQYVKGSTGVPIIEGGIAFVEGRILKDKSVDLGTHTLFIADVIDGAVIREREPMTYAYFRKTK